MRVRAALLGTLATLLLTAPAAAQQQVCADADRPVARTDPGRIGAAVLCIVNAERTTRGLNALPSEPRLDAAARAHSDDMARRGYFDHTSPEGSGPDARATAAGYPWSSISENIAAGQESPREVMEGWMASVGHCQGILSAPATEMGLGLAFRGRARRPYWTQLFGRRQEHGPPPAGADGPAAGCPYDKLSIQPGPAKVFLTFLSRTGSRVRVSGRIEGQPAGRRVIVTVRRAGKSRRRAVRTRAGGRFSARLVAPRGRGRVRVDAIAPGVGGEYLRGRAKARRI